MTNVCVYFQLHQPRRLRRLSPLRPNGDLSYFDDEQNAAIVRRVAERCYLPALSAIAAAVKESAGDFRCVMSITGELIEQLRDWAPMVIRDLQTLVALGAVELLGETYHHSLVCFVGREEFREQVEKHQALIGDLFGVRPRIFRNTELLFSDDLAEWIAASGFHGAIIEEPTHDGHRNGELYQASGAPLVLFTRDRTLSDRVGFRYSNGSDRLTVAEFQRAILVAAEGRNERMSVPRESVLLLGIDFESFGEHQSAETGVVDFLREFAASRARTTGITFVTPGSVLPRINRAQLPRLQVSATTSWADTERDASAWLGNQMQQRAFAELESTYFECRNVDDGAHLETWRRLSTADHFHYMATKPGADGAIHEYFRPYDTPYEAFLNYMEVLTDLRRKCRQSSL